MNISAAEHVTYNGQGGDDIITIISPASGQVITLTPGALAGEGTIAMRNFIGAGGNPLLPIAFTGITTNGALTFADISGTRVDELTVVGSSASDLFLVDSAGNITLSTRTAGGVIIQSLIVTATPGVTLLGLPGLAGDDAFTINGNHPFASGIFVDGGDPSASDAVNFTSDGAAAVGVNLATRTVVETGFGAVAFAGVEVLNVGAGNQAINITGTDGPDSLNLTLTSGRPPRSLGQPESDGQHDQHGSPEPRPCRRQRQSVRQRHAGRRYDHRHERARHGRNAQDG